MTEDEQGFLDFIKQQPWDDNSGRLVYADWLEEHDRLEDAERQRKWVPAEKWLRKFAKQAGCKYEEAIDAAKKYIEEGTESQVGGGLGLDASNAIFDKEKKFWENVSIVTGLPVEGLERDTPFCCCT